MYGVMQSWRILLIEKMSQGGCPPLHGPTDTRVAHVLSFLIPFLALTTLACQAWWPGSTQDPAETQAFSHGPCVPLLLSLTTAWVLGERMLNTETGVLCDLRQVPPLLWALQVP